MLLRLSAAILACVLIAPPAAAEKVLRYAFRVAETGFDPVQINDLYSSIILAHIFDPPLTIDYLARPFKVTPNVTAGMPEVSADGKMWTLRIRPGIYFADDPAFHGKKRELTAQDYVYSLKRHWDPKSKSPNLYLLDKRVVGMEAVRKQALAGGKFDYDREVEGLRAIDRYSFRIVLNEPTPNLVYYLTFCTLACAVAREVIEAYPERSMEKPVVGGYTPEKVALRRAISLAVNPEEWIRALYYGQALVAQSTVPPGAYGFDPEVAGPLAEYNPAKAKALLDVYGYVDRDGDGYREAPDGSKLVLEMATTPDSQGKRTDELWRKFMDRVGIRVEFKKRQWPEHLKDSRAGKLMMWTLGWLASMPDADTFYVILNGPNKGQSNQSRFDLPQWNALYDKSKVLPNSAERDQIYRELDKLIFAYAPLRPIAHRVVTGLSHPWVIGYQRHPVMREFWNYLDIDESALTSRPPRAGQPAATPAL